ncbi:MAG: hypothetical protein GXP22_04185 [Gammaproteobacteria bacterium]|nr:hypothetical protein [Gammaproteobacteria bacterium]
MTRKQAGLKVKLRSIYLWHRHIGGIAAILVLILAITGILINHSQTLEFNKNYIQSSGLLNWYNIHPPALGPSYALPEHSLSQLGEYIYLDTTPVTQHAAPLIGGIQQDEEIIIATRQQLIITTLQGELIEILDESSGLPENIEAIGSDHSGRIILKSAGVNYRGHIGDFTWERVDNLAPPSGNSPAAISDEMRTRIEDNYMNHILTVERVLLDLHSGRILGNAGIWLMDIAAILLILLSLSGSYLWWKQKQKHLKKK